MERTTSSGGIMSQEKFNPESALGGKFELDPEFLKRYEGKTIPLIAEKKLPWAERKA